MKLSTLLFSFFFLLCVSTNAQNLADFHAGFVVGIDSEQAEESLDRLLLDFPDLTIVDANPLWKTQNIAILTFSPDNTSSEIQQMEAGLKANQQVELVNHFYYKDRKIGGLLPEFYVQLKKESDLALLQELASIHQTPIVKSSKYMAEYYTLKTSKQTKNSKEMAAIFRATGQFKFTGYNSIFSFNQHTNDPYYNQQWAIHNNGTNSGGTEDADMDVDEAWSFTMGSPDIKVGLLDSGVDTLHPDLLDNLLPGFDAIGEGKKGFPDLIFQADAHGTACAGIVCAAADNNTTIAGVAPNCKLVPVRIYKTIEVLGAPTFFSTAEIAVTALNWALLDAKVDVISASVGLNDLTILIGQLDTALVEQAIETNIPMGRDGKGSVVLFSAGNDNTSIVAWPARHPMIIAVGASNMCDEKKDINDCSDEDWGGDFGSNLSVSAPGVKVATTDMLPPYGYYINLNFNLTFNGTSAACPNAAGIVALMLSHQNGLTGEDARSILETSCEKVGGYDYDTNNPSGMWSSEMGYGRVNANKAMILTDNFIVNTTDIQSIENSLSVFPNPSSGKVLLEFELQDPQNLQVDLVNHLGQTVIKLNRQNLASGKQQLVWDGQNTNGQSVANGIYFAVIRIGDQQIAQKIIMQR